MHTLPLGAAESVIPIQGKAICGSQSTPTDAQLYQPGHSARSDVEKPQTTHPGKNSKCLNVLDISQLCIRLLVVSGTL